MSVAALVPVILAGGSGTRLWPLSRGLLPKQLLRLAGDRTLLQATAHRVRRAAAAPAGEGTQPLVVVTGEEHRFLVADQLGAGAATVDAILLEPCGRNTAPALTAAALHVAEKGDAVLLVTPADHVVADEAAFVEAVARAAPFAEAGHVVTFGIRPTRPETGFGYLLRGAEAGHGAWALDAFVEKPDAATAARYVDDGQHFWNSGCFMLRSSVWLQSIGHLHPAMLGACEDAMRAPGADGDFRRLDPDAFARCPSKSIDYAVMEPLGQDAAVRQACGVAGMTIVELDAGWSDVGSFEALRALGSADAEGNVQQGDVVAVDSADSLLLAEHRLLATLGVRDLVVIETADAVLVCDRAHSQRVGEVASLLREGGRAEGHTHRRVHRPWGSFESLESGERYQVKRLTVSPGAAISLQMHHHRAEHWVVVRGTARVIRGDDEELLTENESTFIPVGMRHRLHNPGTLPLEIIEVQTGSYLGEDDVVRFEDDYHR